MDLRFWSTFVLLQSLIYQAVSLEKVTVSTCCAYGKNWYKVSGDECPVFDGAVPTVSAQQQDKCRSIVNVCCFKLMSRARCHAGVQIAQDNDGVCSPRLRMRDGGFHINECCHCCRIGQLARQSGDSCSALYPLGKACRGAYRACCQNTPFHVHPTQPSSSTSEFNECALYDSICDQICVDTVESYRCACREGWILNEDGNTCRRRGDDAGGGAGTPTRSPFGGTSCTSSSCDQLCTVRGGKALCSCRQGYQLMPDTKTCRDLDECGADVNICGTGQQCVNTAGSFVCNSVFGPTCLQGHVYNPVTRQCDPVSVAVSCPQGFSFDRQTGRCLQDSPTTECPTGYQFNTTTRRCEDYDECASPDAHRCRKEHESCRNTIGSFICQCTPGYEYDTYNQQCEDVNECARQVDSCSNGQQCENTVGSYHCARTVSCGTGYTLNKDSQVCEDNDECLLNTANCGTAFSCANIPGSFRCTPKECPDGYRLDITSGQCQRIECPDGFQGDRFGQCTDIDECEVQPGPCHPEQMCINSVGSFWCRQLLTCGEGYELSSGGRTCKDVDECVQGTHNCKPSEVCQNRPGTFLCQCPAGFDKNPITEFCEDIDECERYQYCADSADCVNTAGSYLCRCKKGFRSIQGTATCIDVNECLNAGTCAHHCVNSWGSFQCTCREGYQLTDDRRSCEDIDECTVWGSTGRLCPGQCENTQGSYRCTCPDGYTLQSDGKSCTDIDECALGTANCDGADKICFNTRGAYRCLTVACPTGYLRTPSSGNNNIRCQRTIFRCQQDDTQCLQSPLSFSYNFLTFPERIRIPANLFTMRGPASDIRRLDFELSLITARDPYTGISRVGREYFYLHRLSQNEAMVRLLREITAPQDIELELKMIIYDNNGREFGSAVAKISIFVTESLGYS